MGKGEELKHTPLNRRLKTQQGPYEGRKLDKWLRSRSSQIHVASNMRFLIPLKSISENCRFPGVELHHISDAVRDIEAFPSIWFQWDECLTLRHNKQQSSSSFFFLFFHSTVKHRFHPHGDMLWNPFICFCLQNSLLKTSHSRSEHHHALGLNDAWMDEKNAGTAVWLSYSEWDYR